MTKLLRPDNQSLNLRSDEVILTEIESEKIQAIIKQMKHIAMGERDDEHPERPTMVGLAAPQIGHRLRIILIDQNALPDKPNFEPNLKVFINPKVVIASTDEELGREGCYSTGDICGAVYRSKKVTVSAYGPDGFHFEFQSKDPFIARILQHEIDHLDGIRFPLRVRDSKHLYIVGKDDFQEFRKHWKTWDKLCPYEKWLEMYGTDV